MRIIDADAVLALSPFGPLIEALAEAHRQGQPEIGRVLLSPSAESGHGDEGFLVLPAWAPGRALGVKMASVFPQNVAAGEGLPTVQAAYQLFDGRNGSPLAVIDGTMLPSSSVTQPQTLRPHRQRLNNSFRRFFSPCYLRINPGGVCQDRAAAAGRFRAGTRQGGASRAAGRMDRGAERSSNAMRCTPRSPTPGRSTRAVRSCSA